MTVKVKGLSEFVDHCQIAGRRLPETDKRVVQKLALITKRELVAAATPKRLSNMGKRGTKLNAKFTERVDGGVPTALLRPVPPGAWHLLEHGAKTHQIGTRRGRRRGQPGFLGKPGVFAAVGPVSHPGAPGQHTWTKASVRAQRAGSRAVAATIRKTYVEAMK